MKLKKKKSIHTKKRAIKWSEFFFRHLIVQSVKRHTHWTSRANVGGNLWGRNSDKWFTSRRWRRQCYSYTLPPCYFSPNHASSSESVLFLRPFSTHSLSLSSTSHTTNKLDLPRRRENEKLKKKNH